MEPWHLAVLLPATAISFTLSASAGLGGSLLLVPVLVIVVGGKEGIALAALLLGANNVAKTFAYRHTLPIGSAALLILLMTVGAGVGARLLTAVSDEVVALGVLAAVSLAFVGERLHTNMLLCLGSPFLALASGLTSGFSGTSGPLKGTAIRGLGLGRLNTVGAASLASLAGDLTKSAVFLSAGLLGRDALLLAGALIPIMLLSTLLGRRINRGLGERGYTSLFWAVMAGYGVRMFAA